jgi:hypothetical protein
LFQTLEERRLGFSKERDHGLSNGYKFNIVAEERLANGVRPRVVGVNFGAANHSSGKLFRDFSWDVLKPEAIEVGGVQPELQ